MSELICKKQIHLGYTEWQKAKKINPEVKRLFLEGCMFDKWQYIYKYKGKRFSLIQFKGELMEMCYGKTLWEILCPDTDVVRFETRKEAEKYILTNY